MLHVAFVNYHIIARQINITTRIADTYQLWYYNVNKFFLQLFISNNAIQDIV